MTSFLRQLTQNTRHVEVQTAFLRDNAYAAMRKQIDDRTRAIEEARDRSLAELTEVIHAYCNKQPALA